MEWQKAIKDSRINQAIRVLDDGSLATVERSGYIHGLLKLSRIPIQPDLFNDWMPLGINCQEKSSIFNRSLKVKKEVEERIDALENEVKSLKSWL